MLAIALYVLGGALLLIAAIALLVGGALMLFLPQLIIGGTLLILALAIERWRYKPVTAAAPDPGWTDTGERFVDPETGKTVKVLYNAASGERQYAVLNDVKATD